MKLFCEVLQCIDRNWAGLVDPVVHEVDAMRLDRLHTAPAWAVQQYRRTLDLREAIQGAAHPDAAACRNQLAVAYRLADADCRAVITTAERGDLFARLQNSAPTLKTMIVTDRGACGARGSCSRRRCSPRRRFRA